MNALPGKFQIGWLDKQRVEKINTMLYGKKVYLLVKTT